MSEAVLLTGVADAEDCVRRGIHVGRRLLTTDPCAEVYLRVERGVDSACLSRYVEPGVVPRLLDASSRAVDRILSDLEARVSPRVAEATGLSIPYFVPLYSYVGKFQHSAYAFLAHSLAGAVRETGARGILAYRRRCDDFLSTETGLPEVAARATGIPCESLGHPPPGSPGREGRGRWAERWERFSGLTAGFLLRTAADRFLDGYHRLRVRVAGGGRCLVLYNPGALRSLPRHVLHHSVVRVPAGPGRRRAGESPAGGGAFGNLRFPGAAEGETLPDLLLREDIGTDFRSNAEGYLEVLSGMRRSVRGRPLSAAVWGTAPLERAAGLVNGYLMAQGIPVIGAQHGGAYGESYYPWHFDSDFRRCTHYVSYGFRKEDLERLYPGRKVEAEILPIGACRGKSPAGPKRGVDVLYPLVNTLTTLEGGMVRTAPHRLAEAQGVILEYLDSLRDRSVVVKPPPGSGPRNCAAFPVLTRLRRAEVRWNVSLPRFLDRCLPRLIVYDFPSTPLYETLHLDAEVFLLLDDVIPFDGEALSALGKRVHCYDTAEGLVEGLDGFLRGRLERKRDRCFERKYMRNGDAWDRLPEAISAIIGRPL